MDVLLSSRSKIAWAKKNLADFKRESDALLSQDDFHEIFCEPHPDKPNHVVSKVRVAKAIPEHWSNMVGTVFDSLRSALDHAIYGVAVAAGRNNPRNAYFPFSGDATGFEANLKGRCADVPKEIYPLLRAFKPYKGGNEALWALNLIRVTDQHIRLVPVGSATFFTGVAITGIGFWSMPSHPRWDSAKNEMELCTIGPDAKFNGHFDIGFYVAFGEIEWFDGKSAIPLLDQFVDMVETIVMEIEAESKRLGIVK